MRQVAGARRVTSIFPLTLVVAAVAVGLHATRSAQAEPPAIEWEQTFGNDSIHEEGQAVKETRDGGFIVLGNSGTYGDVFLIKTDTAGREEWSRTYGGARHQEGWSVQQTSDGGYVVAGWREVGCGNHPWIFKTGEHGNPVWDRTYGTGCTVNVDGATSIEQTSDEGYVFVYYSEDSSGHNVHLVKIDGDGEVEWSRTFEGGQRGNHPLSVHQTEDGGYIFLGSTEYGPGVVERHGTWLVKADSTGAEEWSRVYGEEEPGTSWTFGRSVRETADGGFIMCGHTDRDLPGGGSEFHIDLVKTDDTGEVRWWEINCCDLVRSAGPTRDGGYFVAGKSRLIKTGGGGKTVWSFELAPGASDMYDAPSDQSAQQTSDGGFIYVGSMREDPREVVADIYLVKLAPESELVIFRRGDANANGLVTLDDAVSTLNYMFRGDAAPTCADAADADDSGAIELTDAVFLLNHLFRGAGPLPAPGTDGCGPDPSEDQLTCSSFPPCEAR